MRRLARPSVLVLAALALGGCSDAPTSPTPGASTTGAAIAASKSVPGCPTDKEMRAQINALFSGSLKGQATGQYAVLPAMMTAGKPQEAQQMMLAFVDWTLQQFAQGSLVGGKSGATRAGVIAFINGLYCVVGLPQPNIPAGALGPDGAAAVVSPSTSPTVVVTETQTAGIQIAANGVTQPTLITITRINTPLLTQLDQYPLYYEFHATPALPGNVDAIVGVCFDDGLHPPNPNRLRVAHNVPDPNATTIEILPLAPAPFLDCTTIPPIGLGPNPSLGEVARYALARAGRALHNLFAPAPLFASYAATTGLGGTTKQLSPFGVVDTLITVTAVSPTSISGAAGAAVPAGALPSVRVATPTDRPVTNYPVSFSVPTGSEGSISGGAATTDGNGVATLGSWTLGTTSGTDLVNGTVLPPHLHSGVAGSPVAFSATVVQPTLVGYQSGGYSYLLIGSGAPPAGWETPSFANEWSVGNAAFGSGGYCPLDNTIVTSWPAASAGVSDLLVRKSVTVPAGWTGSLSIGVAIDNDVQVFVNGTDITASGGTPDQYGFVEHENCATRGSFVFSAPNSLLVPGSSTLIAVRARDRGGISYFDMEATLAP